MNQANQDEHKRKRKAQAFWLKQLHQWHWISAAVSLVGMLLFAVTGITLNHAGKVEARAQTVAKQGQLPKDLIAQLDARPKAVGSNDKTREPLPAALRDWLAGQMAVQAGSGEAEWSGAEIYVSLPRPGGDAWVSIDRASGEVRYERTDRGWISYLNDLHKGRNTGNAWSWFIDIFAVACVVFSATGLLLLQLHSAKRPMTWPTVGIGLLIPVLLAVFLIH